MPNHERDTTKRRLHDKLMEAQNGRKAAAVTAAEDENKKDKSKKVLKKPVPNFGGGKLGTK